MNPATTLRAPVARRWQLGDTRDEHDREPEAVGCRLPCPSHESEGTESPRARESWRLRPPIGPGKCPAIVGGCAHQHAAAVSAGLECTQHVHGRSEWVSEEGNVALSDWPGKGSGKEDFGDCVPRPASQGSVFS